MYTSMVHKHGTQAWYTSMVYKPGTHDNTLIFGTNKQYRHLIQSSVRYETTTRVENTR